MSDGVHHKPLFPRIFQREGTSRTRLALGFVVFVVVVAYLSRTFNKSWTTPLAASNSVGNVRVIVGSVFSPHADVYMAVAGTLRKILPDESIQVFRTPFNADFAEVAAEIGLHSGPYKFADALVEGVAEFNPKVVMLGTCEIDMNIYSEGLWEVWEARPVNNKFTLVCMAHHVDDDEWALNHGKRWAGAGALGVLTISDHVRKSWASKLERWGEQDPSSRFAHVPVYAHAPVLPLKLSGRRQDVLKNAIVQGHLDTERRDYDGLLRDLEDELALDPTAWGYLPRKDGEVAYFRNPSSLAHPFTLHVTGTSGELVVPPALQHVVHVWEDIPYPNFYQLAHQMDVFITAFSSLGMYLDKQASSTVGLATSLEVPLLATRAMRQAYAYADDDRVTLTRPEGMKEVEALKALRTGQWEASSASSVSDEQAVREMLRLGWQRSSQGFADWKEGVWEENVRVITEILSRQV